MKQLLFFVSASLLFACSQPEPKKETKTEVKAEEPKILESVTYDQLIGVWKVTEQRKDPKTKGVKPHPMEDGIIYGFHENGRFMTSSLGLDYVKDMFGTLGMQVKVEGGKIKSAEKSDIFDNQWGENGIEIYLVNDKELVIKFKTFKKYDNPYMYLEKVKL